MIKMRWGMCGAGLICNDFLNAMAAVSENNKAVAIGARSLERAQAVAKTYGIARAYGSYEEVADDPEVDVVYVNVINTAHYDVVSMCLKKGKPVLCEKPLTMTASDTKVLVEQARESKLFLMEAYWSRFFPVYTRLREIIEGGELGDIQSAEASFKVPIEHVPRINDPALGGSALMDIGCYALQFAQWVMQERPVIASVTGELFDSGVDKSSRVELQYSGGRCATLNIDAGEDGDKSATVIGTKGKVQIPKLFWCPTELIINGKTEKYPLPEGAPQKFNFWNSQGLMYEIEHVRGCLEKGLLESPMIPLADTLMYSELFNEIRTRLGAL